MTGTTRAKRANGEGSAVTYDATRRRWTAKYTHPVDHKRRTIRSTISEADCRTKCANALADARRGILPVATGRWTVASWMNHWLDAFVANDEHKPGTLLEYRRIVNNHIVPAIGPRSLVSLTEADVRRVLTTTSAKGLSGTTRQTIFDLLNRAMTKAVRKRHLAENPCDPEMRPSRTTAKVEPWTVEQAAAFLQHVADDRLAAMWTIVLVMGPRRGEAIGLRWGDVDWAAGTLTINGKVDRFTREYEPFRKGHGDPIVHPLPDRIRALLLARREAQLSERFHAGRRWTGGKPGDPGTLVFTARFGTPLGANWVTNRWKRLAVEAGCPLIPHSAIHGGRHFAASAQFALGGRMPEVQAMLGHKEARTTGRYVHLTPQADVALAGRMETLMDALLPDDMAATAEAAE